MAFLVTLALVAVGAAQLAVCWWGSQGRLKRGVVGVPGSAVRVDDRAWHEGHRAAANALGIGGGITMCCAIAVMATGLDMIGVVFAVIGALTAVAACCVATVSASAAARATGTQ